MTERISVIVPVYNLEKEVVRCLKSLCRQTYREIEIIVADDGSTDGSVSAVRRMMLHDPRIRLLELKHGGVAAVRNEGFAASEGEWITFVDADDVVSRTYLEDLHARAKERDAQLVICGYTLIDSAKRKKKPVLPTEYRRFLDESATARFSASWGHFYHRPLLREHGILFDRHDVKARGEDLPMTLYYAAMCERICTLQKAGYAYIQRQGSAMSRFRGLKEIALPYEGLSATVRLIRERGGPVNSRDWYTWFVLRILAQFIDLAKGAPKEETDRLAAYIRELLLTEFPAYDQNPYLKPGSVKEVPQMQQAAVWLTAQLTRRDKLRQFLRVYCR